MRRLTALACLLGSLLCVAPAAAQGPATAAQSPDAALRSALTRAVRAAGASSGAYVLNATDQKVLFTRRASTPRILASNAKLFTTAAVLGRLGPETTLRTSALGAGPPGPGGVLRGDIYLRGSGDPGFGSSAFVRRSYGGGASVEALARAIRAAGVTQVTGGVVGDASIFDSRRGGPSSGFRPSIYVGPLSGLSYNRGLARTSGSAFQKNPPAFAAAQLRIALRRAGVRVAGRARAGRAPAGAQELAGLASPPLARLVAITNKRSDNFFAETLLKLLGARTLRSGSTRAGARSASAFARTLGAPARLADGSGLSRGNRASPMSVGRLLDRVRGEKQFDAFYGSLSIAGRDGTLRRRMRSGPARGSCRGKTGTLSNVSALSGYCTSRSGDTIVFSFLMNGVSPPGARRLQDRMAQALAAYRG